MNIEDIFEKYNDEYNKFDHIENKRSNRQDLHAFLLLDELFPGHRDIVSSAEHDEIWLDIDLDDIEKLTENQILELIRCGIIYNQDYDSLSMFV